MESRGFVYAATGERWIREALASATRLREVHPDTPRILFTDRPDLAAGGPFEEVRPVPDQAWVNSEAKLWSLRHSPFERTVFFDTDTYVCQDVSDLFTVLDRFDMAAVPVPTRLYKRPNHADPSDVPDAFQTANGGLLSWRDNEATRELLTLWSELYQADRATAGSAIRDQPSLRVAMWRSRARIVFLPPEFNFRTVHYWERPTIAIGPIRMIHGRPHSVTTLDRRWNARTEPRLVTPLLQYHVRAMLRPLIRGRNQVRLKAVTRKVRRALGRTRA